MAVCPNQSQFTTDASCSSRCAVNSQRFDYTPESGCSKTARLLGLSDSKTQHKKEQSCNVRHGHKKVLKHGKMFEFSCSKTKTLFYSDNEVLSPIQTQHASLCKDKFACSQLYACGLNPLVADVVVLVVLYSFRPVSAAVSGLDKKWGFPQTHAIQTVKFKVKYAVPTTWV